MLTTVDFLVNICYNNIMKLSNTNLNLYRAFVAVYETQSVRRAGMILGTTHSAISQNIKELTKQVGVRLFNSNNKGVFPTSDADQLYKVVKSAIDSIYAGEAELKVIDKNTKGIIKLGVPVTITQFFKDSIINFCKEFPNMKLMFEENKLALLEENKVDFIIAADTLIKGNKYKKIDFMEFDCIFVASKKFLESHNLSRRISKETLLSLPLIGRNILVDEFPADFSPHMITHSSVLTLSLVREGLGVGYYFKQSFKSIDDEGLVMLDVEDIELKKIKFVIAYKPGNISRIAKRFIDDINI